MNPIAHLSGISASISEINLIVGDLSRKSYRNSVELLRNIVNTFGGPAERAYFRFLLAYFDSSGEPEAVKECTQLSLLREEILSFTESYQLFSFCWAIDNSDYIIKGLRSGQDILGSLLQALDLDPCAQAVLLLTLLDSLVPEIRNSASSHLRALEQSLSDGTKELDSKSNSIRRLIAEKLIEKQLGHSPLFSLLSPQDQEGLIIELTGLTEPFGLSTVPDSYSKTMADCRLWEKLLEALSSNSPVVDLVETLKTFGAGNITPSVVAHVLIMALKMDQLGGVKAHEWIYKFSKAVKDVVFHLSWPEVVRCLDSPDFRINSPEALGLIMQVFNTHTTEPFPISFIYSSWKNTDAQLSWVAAALQKQEVFCFTMYPHQAVESSVLKTTFDDGNKPIHPWKCIDLLETLLLLGESGHQTVITQLLSLPSKTCPELLLAALMKAKTPGQFRQQVLKSVIELFLKEPIEQYKITKAIDIIYEQKGLLEALKDMPIPISVDLAVAASKLKYLKLDKWVTDRMGEHHEPFVTCLMAYVKKRLPVLASAHMERDLFRFAACSPETLLTIITCLHNSLSWLSQEVADNVRALIASYSQVVKPNPPTHAAAPIGFGPSSAPGWPSKVGPASDQTGGSLFSQTEIHKSASMGSFPNVFGSDPGSGSQGTSAPSSLPIGGGSSSMPLPSTTSGSSSSSHGFPASGLPSMMPSLSHPMLHPSGNYGVSTHPGAAPSMYGVPGMSRQHTHLSHSSGSMGLGSLGHLSAHIGAPQTMSRGMGPTLKSRSPEVDEEVISIFYKLSNPQVQQVDGVINDIIRSFKKMRQAEVPKEKDVIHWTIKTVLADFRNFQFYQERDLHILGTFVGRTIDALVLSNLDTGLVLRVAAETLKKPSSSRLIAFGTATLTECKSRLRDFPNYCCMLISMPMFKDLPPQLQDYIEYGVKSDLPPFAKTMDRESPQDSNPGYESLIGGPLEPALSASPNIQVPPEATMDRISFIFNNMVKNNLDTKVAEFKKLLDESHQAWFAQFFVQKRVMLEPNLHQLYADFLKVVGSKSLSSLVHVETLRAIKMILCTKNLTQADRNLLKNLGRFFGLITIADNQPILHKDLDPRNLIVYSYSRGPADCQLVVPFITKILEACSSSRVLKPPNPWIMAVLSTLVEVHEASDVQTPVALDIELLFKNLTCDLKTVSPSKVLIKPEPSTGDKEMVALPESQPPLYLYMDIKTDSFACLTSMIIVNPNIKLFSQYPNMRTCAKASLERAVQEMIMTLTDKVLKVAVSTVENMIKRDFAFEQDELRMKNYALDMTRHVCSALAMITFKEHLNISIATHLKTSLLNLTKSQNIPTNIIDSAATMIASDNVELACGFVQKTCVERAQNEIERKLAMEFDVRRLARQDGTSHFGMEQMVALNEILPEVLRPKHGSISANMQAVCEEFSKQIPGFLPPVPTAEIFNRPLCAYHTGVPTEMKVADEFIETLQRLYSDSELSMRLSQTSYIPGFQSILDLISQTINSKDMRHLVRLLHKVVDVFMNISLIPIEQELMSLLRTAPLQVLIGLRDARPQLLQSGAPYPNCHFVVKHVARAWMSLSAESKYHPEPVSMLVRSNLLDVKELDNHLSQQLADSSNQLAANFAINLCRTLLVPEHGGIGARSYNMLSPEEMHNSEMNNYMELNMTLEALAAIVQRRSRYDISTRGVSSDFLVPPVDAGVPFELERPEPIQQPRQYMFSDVDDGTKLVDKFQQLFRDWTRLFAQNPIREQERYIPTIYNMLDGASKILMNTHGIQRTDETVLWFLRISLEICLENYRNLDFPGNIQRPKSHTSIDAFSRLVVFIIKSWGENAHAKNGLLCKILLMITNYLLHEHDKRTYEFQRAPFHRLLSVLLYELFPLEHTCEDFYGHVLTAYAHFLHLLKPARATYFTFSWLELVSHRMFMPKLLNAPSQMGWAPFHILMQDLLVFLAPFLRNPEISKPVGLLYKGTLRVLLVLLHDFPEFLSDYHYSFCDIIPANCLQMRNLILSAFPRTMKLPDPFTPNLKVDLLPDIIQSPRICIKIGNIIQPTQLKKDLDVYLKTRAPSSFLAELKTYLKTSGGIGSGSYETHLINAIVLYVGQQAVLYHQGRSNALNVNNISHTSHLDIFQALCTQLDTEGRYLFLNAITNQLRYPNSHTHYFSCTLLYLFAEASMEAIQEQITRVLLERLIVNRPHPWGLLITFIELIKNPCYKFWKHDFVHCAPEIEKLFESVAKSCMQQQQQQQVQQQQPPPPPGTAQGTSSEVH